MKINFYFFLSTIFIITVIGLFVPIMEVDATQYASISWEMLQNKSWLKITDLGADYLDKPPLLFWLSSASMALLGNGTVAYKLPSFIIAWLGVYFLYQLVLHYYGKSIAQLAVLCYTYSVAFVLFTNDIRTDTLMLSFVILAVWQLALYFDKPILKHALWGSVGIGLSMLAKGPIGMVVPVLALVPHVVFKGKYKNIFTPGILLAPLVVLILLSPMLYGLYEQFGMHGIRFYFWEQSFGRITGENTWKNDAGYFYFLHNIAWAYIPLILFFVYGFIHFIVKGRSQKEYISFFGFLLPFIALSFSHYKLPHYIFVVIPFASMLAAKGVLAYENNINRVTSSIVSVVQGILLLALLGLTLALLGMFHQILLIIYALVVLVFIFIGIYFLSSKEANILFKTTLTFFGIAVFVLNLIAYPGLLKYQSSSEVAFYINENNIDKSRLYQHNIYWRGFYYYTGKQIPQFSDQAFENQDEIYVYLKAEDLTELQTKYELEILKEFKHFSVTRLSLLFLNPNTRHKTLQYYTLIKIKKHHEKTPF